MLRAGLMGGGGGGGGGGGPRGWCMPGRPAKLEWLPPCMLARLFEDPPAHVLSSACSSAHQPGEPSAP